MKPSISKILSAGALFIAAQQILLLFAGSLFPVLNVVLIVAFMLHFGKSEEVEESPVRGKDILI